jgi:carbon storage regulator
MLVLSRRTGQTIAIAGDIRVSVIAIQGKKVRLGIEAPRSIHVDREEVAAQRTVAAAPGVRNGHAAVPLAPA